MGGHITVRSMVVTGDIDAGVIWGGVVASYPDLLTSWRRGPRDQTPTPTDSTMPTRIPSSTRNFFRSYGSPEENPAFWASISANSYVADLSGPIQLHHAMGDEVVPYEFSELLFHEIEAVGLPVELYLYNGDNHNISINFELAMARSLRFFDQHVKFGN
jgi:dienelactone hydrolase